MCCPCQHLSDKMEMDASESEAEGVEEAIALRIEASETVKQSEDDVRNKDDNKKQES